jgi:hypothetical protein
MIEAIPAIRAAFKKARARHERGIERGLKMAGVGVLRASQHIVPTDLGVLKATGHVRHEGRGFETVVIIGYGTDYGIYVHEELEKAHGEAYNTKYAAQIKARAKYWYKGDWRTYHKRRPQEQAKFLITALHDQRAWIKRTVRTEMVR